MRSARTPSACSPSRCQWRRQNPFSEGARNLTGSFPDPGHRRLGDALLGGQQLGGRVAAVATGGRHHVPLRVRSGSCRSRIITSGRPAPAPRCPARAIGGQCDRILGGDVECPGHSTEGVPTGEGRSEQGDGHGPGPGTSVNRQCWTRRSPNRRGRRRARRARIRKAASTSSGSAGQPGLPAESGGQIIDSGRSVPPSPSVGELDLGQLRRPTLAKGVDGEPPQPASGARVARVAFGRTMDEVVPARPSRPQYPPGAWRTPEGWASGCPTARPGHCDAPARRDREAPARHEVRTGRGCRRLSARCRGGDRREPTIGRRTLHQVGDDHVGMELGIPGSAGPVSKGGADEAIGLDELVPPAPRRTKQASVESWSSTATMARSWAIGDRLAGVI